LKEQPIRLGMVGCGVISHAHAAAAARSSPPVRFVACASRRADVAADWAARYGAAASYTDYEQMLAREELDGVVLTTWPNQHREHVGRCLDAGVRFILCEKALTNSAADALALWQATEAAGAVVLEAFMYRHHPAIRHMKETLASGALGPVDSISAAFNYFDPETASPDDAARDWRQRSECAGGAPWDFTCYPVNACAYFSDALPARVFATGGTGRYGTVNRLHGVIEFENGVVGQILSSKRAGFNQALTVHAARGSLTAPIAWTNYHASTIEGRASSVWGRYDVSETAFPPADSYQIQLEHFAALIRGEAQPLLPLAESVINTFILDGLVRSLREGQAVEIALPEPLRASKSQLQAG
jgi:predicted dehydrogenase